MALSAVLVWQSLDRVLHPVPVVGWLPVSVGAAAALGNWGVARILRDWQHRSAAIRLAYLHNVGDIYISLAPILAGLLVSISGFSSFDPLIAMGVALWLIGSTAIELRRSGGDLLWPEDATCPHEELKASARP